MADDQPLPDLMGYATPNELAFKRLYARHLLEQGTPDALAGPAVSPFQGIGGVLNQLAGQRILGEAAQQERATNANSARAQSGVTTGAEGPLSMQPPTGNVSDSGPLGQGPYSKVTSAQEGSGSYAQLGPVVKSPETGQPDRAYGKYQVMGNNIPQWTKEVLGAPLTPAQFLSNPQAQEAVYKTKFGQLVQQYGPEGAARAWLGGPKGMTNPGAQAHTMDGTPLGQTVGQYGQNFTKLASNAPGLPQGAAAPGGAIAAPPVIGSPQVPPALPGGMLASLPPSGATPAPNEGGTPPVPGGGTQLAAGRGFGTSVPNAIPAAPGLGAPGQVPGTSQGTMSPGFFAQRPHISKEQYQSILANPAVSQEQKQFYTNLWLGQGQPTSFETPYGTIVRAPNGQQQFIGKVFEMPIKGPNGMEITGRAQYNADGSYKILQPGAAAPVGGPAPSPQGAPSAGPLSAPPPVAPPAAPGAVPGPSGAVQSAMPKLAALETGTMNDAGPLGAPPPNATGAVPVPPIEKPAGAEPQAPAGVQTAQSIIPQFAKDTFDEMGNIAAQTNLKTSAATKAGEEATSFVNDIRTKGMVAADDAKKLDMLAPIVHSQDYYSGFGSPLVMLEKRMVAALGGDPKTAANMEMAEKFMNDLNLDTLKQRLGGLGQIRVFEGNMVQNAFLNRDNSVVANQALVTYAKAVNDRLLQANEMTNKLLAENNWVPSPKIQAEVFNFFRDKPIMDDATAKAWNQSITRDAEQRKKTSGPMVNPPPGAGVPAPPPGFR
jgi:hypothetical protein